jgi:hypothetical protein
VAFPDAIARREFNRTTTCTRCRSTSAVIADRSSGGNPSRLRRILTFFRCSYVLSLLRGEGRVIDSHNFGVRHSKVHYNSIVRWIRVPLDLSFKKARFFRGCDFPFFYSGIRSTCTGAIFLIVRCWHEAAMASSCTAQSLDPVFFLSLVLRSLDTHKNNISDCAIVA